MIASRICHACQPTEHKYSDYLRIIGAKALRFSKNLVKNAVFQLQFWTHVYQESKKLELMLKFKVHTC